MPKEILLSRNNEEKDDRTAHGIKHWGLSDYLNILPHIKFGVSGQESSTQSPTFHTSNLSKKWLMATRHYCINKTSKSAKMKSIREIFKTNPSLLDEPEVAKLFDYC